jgi:hypothetical protein
VIDHVLSREDPRTIKQEELNTTDILSFLYGRGTRNTRQSERERRELGGAALYFAVSWGLLVTKMCMWWTCIDIGETTSLI